MGREKCGEPCDEPKSRSRCFGLWKINRRDSVIADVTPRKFDTQLNTENLRETQTSPPSVATQDRDLQLRARSERLRLEIFEYAYDQSVAALVLRQRMLQFGAIALSVIVLTLQYMIGDQTHWASIALTHAQTIFALFLLIGVIWALVFRWDGMLERQTSISHDLHRLVSEYSNADTAGTITQRKMAQWEKARSAIDTDRKNSLARLPQRCIQRGHRHVAKKYPEFEMKCFECGRVWKDYFSHSSFWHMMPWCSNCNNCGVPLDERKLTRRRIQSSETPHA